MCLSKDVDVIETVLSTASEPKAVVLLLGKGGGGLSDLRSIATWYQTNCHVLATTMCGFRDLREKQIDALLEKAHSLSRGSRARIIVHVFSNTGYYLWGQVLRRWRQGYPNGFAGPDDALFGVIYDSASDAAMAADLPGETKAQTSYPADLYAQNVVMNCLRGTIQTWLPECISRVSLKGEEITTVAFRWAERWSAGKEDPCFGRGPEEWLDLGKAEPPEIRRLLLYGAHDTVVRAEACERFQKWLEMYFGCTVTACRFDRTVHAQHYELEGGRPYFSALSRLLALIP